MMVLLTDATIKTTLAGQLGIAEADLPAHWTPLITLANQMALADLMQHFQGFGYTPGQVESWADAASTTDRGAVYHQRQALFWAGVLGEAHLTENQQALLKELDCRTALPSTLTDGGNPIDPPDDDDVAAGAGVMKVRQDFDDTIAAGRSATDQTYVW
jgi:hypothetical protein